MLRAVNPKWSGRLAAVAVLAASFVLAGCSEVLSRDAFTARVQHKSDAEVAKEIGKPAAIDASAPDHVKWTYNSRTFNVQERNKFDKKTVVVFRKAAPDGKLQATDVVFE